MGTCGQDLVDAGQALRVMLWAGHGVLGVLEVVGTL